MLTIGQVAARTGLRASAIRYYEARGLLPKPSRQAGRRMYSTSILERLAVIDLAKIAGFSLTEIRALLSALDVDKASVAWRKLVPRKAAEIDARMNELVEMKRVLAKLNACRCATLVECGQVFIRARSKEPHNHRLQPTAADAIVSRRG